MEQIKDFFEKAMQNKLIDTIIVIVVSFLIYRIFHRIITKGEKNSKLNKSISNKGKTYFKMILNIIRYVFIIITTLVVLQINGVDVSSMLAGVGIVSVILGLAVQDALKDIIRGISIISDNYFSVGDVIRYNGIEGKVIEVGLKTTKVQETMGGIVSIANRNIEQIEIISDLLLIKIPMPYEVPLNEAERIVQDIVKVVETNEGVKQCEYKGVQELADSSINYSMFIHCNIDSRFQVKRDALRAILQEFEKNGISVPYNQIDVHNK